MTNENDLIRRGDAHDAVRNTVFMSDALEAIAALPAVAASQPADLETCGRCMGSGYGGHPDSSALCNDCNGSGAVAVSQPADPVIKADSCQRVTVKPLVWRGDSIRLTAGRMGKMYECMWCFHGQKGAGWSDYDEDWHPTLEAAKAAAQADYEARILAAIDTQPDPRDAVIARLVEAAAALHLEWAIHVDDHLTYRVVNAGNEAWTNFQAAIAAAKGGAA
jgi:hypothetical protein